MIANPHTEAKNHQFQEIYWSCYSCIPGLPRATQFESHVISILRANQRSAAVRRQSVTVQVGWMVPTGRETWHFKILSECLGTYATIGPGTVSTKLRTHTTTRLAIGGEVELMNRKGVISTAGAGTAVQHASGVPVAPHWDA